MAIKTIFNSEITSQMTEDEIDYINNYYFDDELGNLNGIHTEEPIIAIADMGLWNGRRQGYKVCGTSLSSILTVGNNDDIHLYYDGFNVRKTSYHHDGTNYILFREFKPGVNQDKFIDLIYSGETIDSKTLNRYTRSLRKYVKSVYGF
jgi:hypothetical protein